MNVVGRQMSRSNSSSHHQRQYSDHLIDASSSNKWLQSASLSQVLHFYENLQKLFIADGWVVHECDFDAFMSSKT
jgi:hypothetical protein